MCQLSCTVPLPQFHLSLCTASVSLMQGLTMCRPSLHQHYLVSAVLLRHPTPALPFGFLRLLRCRPYSYMESNAGLPSCYLHIVHHAWLLDPGAVFVCSPYRLRIFCLPITQHRRPASFLLISWLNHFQA